MFCLLVLLALSVVLQRVVTQGMLIFKECLNSLTVQVLTRRSYVHSHDDCNGDHMPHLDLHFQY